MKGALTRSMRRCLFKLREDGGLLERRQAGLWTSSVQPPAPAWTVSTGSVEAMIARGLLVVTRVQRTGYARPSPVCCRPADGVLGG